MATEMKGQPTVGELEPIYLTAFGDRDRVAAMLEGVHDHESNLGATAMQQFAGYRRVIDCFHLFLHESIRLAESQTTTHPRGRDEYRMLFLLDVASQAKRLRAAHVLAYSGHPMLGAAILRDVTERALLYAAILHGWTSFKKICGGDALPKGKAAVVRARQNSQRIAIKRMLQAGDGLDAAHIAELRNLKDLVDGEVHGTWLTSMIEGSPWIQGDGPFPLFSDPSESTKMYVNRSVEAAWLLLRTLPLLQLDIGAFREQWAARWRLLDYSLSRLAQIDKPLFTAFRRLVEVRLTFSPATHAYRDNQ